jgi:hypothetical protein
VKDQDAIERWVQVDRLLDRVLALPSTERVVFVQQQTSDDPRLRDEVLTLLAVSRLAAIFSIALRLMFCRAARRRRSCSLGIASAPIAWRRCLAAAAWERFTAPSAPTASSNTRSPSSCCVRMP